jgi:hypothetical protein
MPARAGDADDVVNARYVSDVGLQVAEEAVDVDELLKFGKHYHAALSRVSATSASRFFPSRIARALRCSASARRMSSVKVSFTWAGGREGSGEVRSGGV